MSYSYLINLFIIDAFINCDAQTNNDTNQWTKDIGLNGEDIWRSTSDFIPVQSQSFGTIQLGDIMSVEFDFIWSGRSNDPRAGYYENFFRVGYDATIADNCYGEGARYPSFWLTNDINTMHVSISSGIMCQPSHSLSAYGAIIIGVSYHINIFFNSTQVRVDVFGGNKPNWFKIWPRAATQKQFLGDQVPVWWMTNTFSGSDFNRGNAIFSNITMISKLLTDKSDNPTINPTNNPTVTPRIPPIIECKHNEDCDIVCKHPYDCHLRNVLCPKTNHSCNIYCAAFACQYITINAYFINGGTMNVECNGTRSCFGATIDAQHSTNTTLFVQLRDAQSLSNSNIYCADLHCNIMTINDHESLEGLLNSHIIAQESTQSVSLILNGDRVLKNGTVQCPQFNLCQIIVGNNEHAYSDMLTNAVIQSHGGLHDIQLISDDATHGTPRIECGANYEYSCAAVRAYAENEIYWLCDHDDNVDSGSDFMCDDTDYIQLMCVITGGNTVLINKQVQNIEQLLVLLDGSTFSYDPWMQMRGKNALNKSHLSFEWKCRYTVGVTTNASLQWIDCNQMFDGLNQESVVYAHFDTQTIVANEYYLYQYTLNVSDTTNSKRMCASIPSVTVSISTVPNEEDMHMDIPLLVAYIQALDHIIIKDHIRLIGKLSILDGTDVDQYFYTYLWSEISGELSANELEIISNSIHQKNLIIDSFSLIEGNEYELQLVVTQYEDSAHHRYIQSVESQPISIMVNAANVSIMLQNSSVIIDDDCMLNPVKYETLHELFDGFFNITLKSMKANEAVKNRYQFAYSIDNYMDNEKILLHPSLITSETHFNHFILPLSSFIIFHVEIVDEYYKSVEINTTQFCMIQIEENVNSNQHACISYKEDVFHAFQASETSTASHLEQKQLFGIQTSHSILHLLQNISISDTAADLECKQQHVIDVLNIMSDMFVELCQSDFVLQLAQVLTHWIHITLSDSYLSETLIDNLVMLYNLSVRVLDPCLSFMHMQEHELIACSDSVITSRSAVCYKGQSIALDLSQLFTTNRYLYIFLSFIESLISVLDRTSHTHTDLFTLIRKSLYVYQLLRLSVSIPYERFIYDSTAFQLCSHRTINENVECNASDISVVLMANDTKRGRKELDDIDPDLNGVDITVIFLRTNKSNASVFDPCSHNKQQNELQGRSASVILSSDLNTSNLTSNVSITFNSLQHEMDSLKCVWYDEENSAWDTSGCSTIIDEKNARVLCSCSHLTTFSTIKFLYNDCLNVDLRPSMNNYPYVSNLVFLILFFGLFSKITSDFILIFDGAFVKRFKKHQKDGALSGPGSVYICTVFELLVCIEFHIAFTFEWNSHQPILIFTLLLPLLSFCWMFLCILRTWIRITHSFGADMIVVQRVEKGMIVFMILFICFVAIEAVLIYLQHNYFIYGEIIWCFIMSIFTIIYLFYATAAIRTIWRSVRAVKNDIINQKDDQDTKLLTKLLIVSILLAIYFLIKTLLSIYLVSNHEYSFAWRIIDMLMEFVSLCIIYCLYGGGIKRLVTKYNNTAICIKCYHKCQEKCTYIKPKSDDEITASPTKSVEMKEKSNATNRKPHSQQTHVLVVSQSRQPIEGSTIKPSTKKNIKFRTSPRNKIHEPGAPRIRRPQLIECPSATASNDTLTETHSANINYRTPTITTSNRRNTKRHRSTIGSYTLSLSALPILSQMESGLDEQSNSDSHNPHYHHMINSSSSYDSSLFGQFSNAARTRFPCYNIDADAPLPEQSDCFEESSHKSSMNISSDIIIIPGQKVSNDSLPYAYHE